MRRIGVFGGTFDPVHDGHLKPAAQAAQAFGLDELVFVPAGNPPHKLDEPRTAFAHRFAMLALATQDDDRLLVSAIELAREGPSYTVDTLSLFRERYGAAHLYFLMGSDSFAQIGTWHRWEALLPLANLVVLRRPAVWGDELMARAPDVLRPHATRVERGAILTADTTPAHRVYLLDHEPYPISSTEVRERVRSGRPIGDLMPAAVGRYIAKHHLYRSGEKGADER
jgi:nicotinate-nucleotide adenylyltransferase